MPKLSSSHPLSRLLDKTSPLAARLRLFLIDKNHLAMGMILAVAAYLRIWNLSHLFNMVHDYDEGVYSLASRFMLQGYQPYTDFTLVHPPLYNLVLTGIYGIFGYDFMYGKYLSVALALISVILIYVIGKKLYHPSAGIVAALFFAVSPDMVYLGRRVVQHSLGIFLVLIAIYFAVGYIQRRKPYQVLVCGLLLGLSMATKYVFIPVAAGITIAIVLISLPDIFRQTYKVMGRGSFWIIYMVFFSLILAFLLALRWIFLVPILVPFVDPISLSALNFINVMVVLALPLIPAWRMQPRDLSLRDWRSAILDFLKQNTLWLLLGGMAAGFFCVTGYYLVTAPAEFIQQTFLAQTLRPYNVFPSFIAVLQDIAFTQDFLKLSFLPILFTLPLVIIMLRKRDFSSSNAFVCIALFFTFLFCQFMYPLPRYYIAMYPFIFLGLASFIPALDTGILKMRFKDISFEIKTRLLVMVSVVAFWLCLTLVLFTNYVGYDTNDDWVASNEEEVYSETVSFLEQAGAQKIYASNPIFPALSSKLNSTLEFDSFELLWFENRVPDELVATRIAEGVDYIVLDSWVGWWQFLFKEQADKLVQAVRRQGRLVKIIAAGEPTQVEIYSMTSGNYSIFNGEFDNWITTEDQSAPLGWRVLSVGAEGDKPTVKQAEVKSVNCAWLSIYEDGKTSPDYETIYAALTQTGCNFPQKGITFTALPTESTTLKGNSAYGAAIHFVDGQGNALIVGFSDKIETETSVYFANGTRLLVIRPATFEQWAQFEVDLAAYWTLSGWTQSEHIDIYITVLNDYLQPGEHSFGISGIIEN